MTDEHRFLTREFKRFVWPLCRIHGFSRIDGRTMWRYRDGMIDVVNLQGNGWNRTGEPQGFFINIGVWTSPDFMDTCPATMGMRGCLHAEETSRVHG